MGLMDRFMDDDEDVGGLLKWVFGLLNMSR
jgi:hypothetical protein